MVKEYVVYLIHYKGEDLPPFYVGSSSMSRLEKGYRGSPKSIEWGALWEGARRSRPELFEYSVVSRHFTREGATNAERVYHEIASVVSSPFYANKAVANKGSFTSDSKGVNNNSFGNKCPDHVKKACSENNKGKMTIFSLELNRYSSILIEDFDEKLHLRYSLGDNEKGKESRAKIAKSTSAVMSELVSKGEHWFQTQEFKDMNSRLRKGVPMPEAQKIKMGKTLENKYLRGWETDFYSWLDFEKAYLCYLWYINNYKYKKRKSSSDFNSYCEEVGFTGRGVSWMKKVLSPSSKSHDRTVAMFELYIKENK